jgi:hypothetical protein
MLSLWLAAKEKKSPVDSIEFGGEDAGGGGKIPGPRTRKQYLPILGEITHQYTQLYGPGNVRVIPRNTDGT